jgi:hypothetical protein
MDKQDHNRQQGHYDNRKQQRATRQDRKRIGQDGQDKQQGAARQDI